MLLAVEAMSPTVQAIFLGAAGILFVLATIGASIGRVNLVAAGLALFVFVFFWTAFSVS